MNEPVPYPSLLYKEVVRNIMDSWLKNELKVIIQIAKHSSHKTLLYKLNTSIFESQSSFLR